MSHPRPGRRRSARRLAAAAVAVLAFIVLAAAALYGALQTGPGRAMAARAIEAAVSGDGLELTIGRLEGTLPQRLRLGDVVLRDAGGEALRIETAALDWRPWALLGGRIAVDALRLDGVFLARLPETTPASGPAPSQGLPRWDVSVDRLSIDRLRLGPDILGVPARLSVTGRLAARDGDVVTTRLSVLRTDGARGRATVEAVYRLSDDRLRLSLDANEPAGGLIARALDFPGLPPVAIGLSGDGPVSNWRGDVTAIVDGVVSVAGEVRLGRRDGILVSLAGSAVAGERLPAPWPALAGDAAFDLAVRWTAEEALVIERAALTTRAARLTLTGQVQTRTGTLALDGGATVSDGAVAAALLPGLRLGGATLTVRAEGPLARPGIDATLTAEALAGFGAAAERVQLAARATPAADGARLAIEAQATLEGLSGDALAPVAPALDRAAEGTLSGTLDLATMGLDASAFTLASGPARLSGRFRLGLADGTADGAATLALADLRRLAPLLGFDVGGRASLEIAFAAGADGALTAKLDGALTEAAWPDPALAALAGRRVGLAAQIARDVDGALAATEIRVDGAAARATGRASLPPTLETLRSDWTITVADLSVLSQVVGARVAGALEARGALDGATEDPNLGLRLTVRNAAVAGVALGEVTGSGRVSGLAAGPSGHVEVRAAPSAGAVAAETDLAVAGQVLSLTGLRIAGLGGAATGALRVPLSGAPLTGALSVEAERLAPALALVGADGEGRLTGRVRLDESGGRQAAEADAEITATALALEPGRRLDLARLEARVRATDIFGTPAGTVSLDARSARLGEDRIDRLALTAEGRADTASWRLTADGDVLGALNLSASGRVSAAQDRVALDLDALSGTALGRAVALRRPARVSRGGGAFALEGLALGFAGGTVSADLALDPERLRASLSFGSVPLTALALGRLPEETGGSVSASLSVEGPRADPTGEARLDATGISVTAEPDQPALALALRAAWRDRRLSVDGRLSSPDAPDATLALDLPLVAAPDALLPYLPPDAPASGRLAWAGQIEPLWQHVPLPTHRLSGAAKLDVALSGSLGAPRLAGAVTLDQGRYENLETGTLLRDIALDIDFADDQARIVRFTANDGASGRIQANGEARLDPAGESTYRLAAQFADFLIVRRDEIRATADGTVTVSGGQDRATVKGAVETREVEVRLIDRLPPEIVTLDVVESGAEAGAGAAAEAPPPRRFDVGLDLGVAMHRRVFVRGRGLDSEWSGALHVGGTAESPAITGKLTLVRGQMSLLGKVFRLTSGSVTFPGGEAIVPELDVEAHYAARGITAIVQLKGPATAPSITFSSQPELPRDEVIARILFDKTSAQLTPLEAAQLAAAVAQLTSSGGPSPFDFARRLVGVDVLRVATPEAGGTGGPAIEAGKYVTENVYVGVKKGVTDTSGAVNVEVEVTPNISVESETGSAVGSDVGVRFKWDY